MDYKEFFLKLWEISGPPEDMEDVKKQDQMLLEEILQQAEEDQREPCNCPSCKGEEKDFFQMLIQMAGVELRKFIMNDKDHKSMGMKVETIELDSPEKLFQVMKNVKEGRHPLDNGEEMKKFTHEDVDHKLDDIFRRASGGDQTH